MALITTFSHGYATEGSLMPILCDTSAESVRGKKVKDMVTNAMPAAREMNIGKPFARAIY